MLVPLLITFLLLALLVFCEEYIGKYKWMMYIIIALLMILCAGMRPIGFDRDSYNYQQMFLHPDSSSSSYTVEPLFLLFCNILYLFSDDARILLFAFAMIGITIKFCAIRQLTPLLFLPLIIYFGNFYMLHEITQIRAGIVSGLFLLMIIYISEGKRLYAFLLIILGAGFHFSALALLPLLLLNNKPLNRMMKVILASIVPLCFLLYALNIDFLTTISIPYVTNKVELYKTMSEFGVVEKESILNPFPLMKMAVLLYLLYFSDTIENNVPMINIIIKVLACSLIVYFGFSSVKTISTRLSELYGIVEIIAYPCIYYTIRPVFVGKILVCIMAMIEIYFNCVQWEFFDFTV